MDPVKALIARADRYARRARVKRTTVSKKLFNDTFKLDRLEAGEVSITQRVLEQGLQRLGDLESGRRVEVA